MTHPTDTDTATALAVLRREFDELLPSLGVVPPDVGTARVSLGGVPALEVTVPGADDGSVLLYLHGGAYVFGSATASLALTAAIARASRSRAVSLDYRLAPEHPFPAAVEDATAAYLALLESGVAPERIAVAGESAGGGLCLALLLVLRDRALPLPAAAAAAVLSPWTDLTLRGASYEERRALDPVLDVDDVSLRAAQYAGGTDPAHPLVSPVSADLRGLPPLLVQVGSLEILLDDATALAARAAAADVDVTLEVHAGQVHVFQSGTGVSREADDALASAGSFLRRHWSRTGASAAA